MTKYGDVTVGVNIARRRRAAQMNQLDLAAAVGISRTSIANIEIGRQNINAEQLATIAAVLAVTVADLLDGSTYVPRGATSDLSAPDFPHGSNRGYQRGCRCGSCRTANTRRHMEARTARKKDAAIRVPHGLGGYNNYLCRCPTCVRANAEHIKARSEQRKGATTTPHGTRAGFMFHLCRCEDCIAAYNEYSRERQARCQAETGGPDARRARLQWTGPELEIASREDLTAKQVGLMIGRSYWAVLAMRKRLKEPMPDHIAGVSRPKAAS